MRASRRAWTFVGLCGVLLGGIRVEGLADPNVLWGTRDGLDILSSGHLAPG